MKLLDVTSRAKCLLPRGRTRPERSAAMRLAASLLLLTASAAPVLGQEFLDPVPPAPAPEESSEWTRIPVGRPTPAMVSPSTRTASVTGGAGLPTMQAVPTPVPVPARRNTLRPAYQKVADPGQRVPPSGSVPKPQTDSRVTQLGKLPVTGKASTVHFEKSPDAEFMQPLAQGAEPPVSGFGHKTPQPGMYYPTERMAPPSILGSQLGLQPGETATERSLRLMSALAESQSTIEALERRNQELSAQIKHKDDQLLLAIREIRSARKDVAAAWDDLKRVQEELKALQDKVREADRDNAALLQSMAPLLQKLLDEESRSPAAEVEE